jgi:flagellar hook-associated protein 2
VTGIQLSGLASGMDTDAIIQQMMSIEAQPRTRVARQQVAIQARQDALRSIDTKLTALKLAAGDLRSATMWLPSQTVASGNESVLSARQLTGAAPGGYPVTVTALATADARTYSWNAGGGTIDIAYKANGVDASKSFDLTGQTLDEAVATINGESDSPLWAVNVGGKLSLSRRETGDHASWGFEASGAAIGAATNSRDGTDASYTITGDPTTYASHTNVATDGLPGLELTLKSLGTATVTVSPPAANPDGLKSKIKAFVSAYNDAVDLVRGELTEKRVTDPQTDDDAKLGVLFGDATLGGLLSKMRQTISEAGLDQLGVSVVSSGAANSPDTLAGKLTFDESTFDDAWAADPLAVKAKIGSPDAPGFAQDFEADLDPFTRAGDGLLDTRVGDADRELSYVKDTLDRIDQRLQTKEDLLRKQFTALEEALSQSQSQSADLSGQLASLMANS